MAGDHIERTVSTSAAEKVTPEQSPPTYDEKRKIESTDESLGSGSLQERHDIEAEGAIPEKKSPMRRLYERYYGKHIVRFGILAVFTGYV